MLRFRLLSVRHLVASAVTLLLALTHPAFAQLPTPTYGWNLGNTLEPPGGEGAWGPAATQNLINSVADAGFNTVRLPVAWNSHANQTTYVIDAAWMARVKQVVDWCYARNLHVIINCHWDNGWLENNITGTVNPTINAKMDAYWTQIATTFKDYDAKLIFAGANEPNADTAPEVATLMSYYQTFINAVRATGGNNATRWLAIQGPNTDIDLADSLMNTLPTDSATGRLMVEVHYYTPYQYTLMTADADWGKMFYFWGQGYHHPTRADRNANWAEEAYMSAEFEKMRVKFVSRGIPVILGEFQSFKRAKAGDLTGTDHTLHVAARTYFHKTVVETANAKGLKPIYWDIAGQMFNWTTGAITDADNVRALTGGPALAPDGTSALAITTAPRDFHAPVGATATFSVAAGGVAPLTYQWKKDGVAIGGATSATLSLTNVSLASAGSYTVTVTNAQGSVTSSAGALVVGTSGGRVPAISMRARVGTGSEILVPGIVVGGSSPQQFLVRALGPKLGDFGIDAATRLGDPLLKITTLDGTVVAQNDDWSTNTNAAAIVTTTTTLGAQPLTAGSKDAVLLTTLAPGIYTPQISGVGNTSGVSLVEFYNVDPANKVPAISMRARVGTGSEILVPGLVIEGSAPKMFLIRALGPKLGDFGIDATTRLNDPLLKVTLLDGTVVAQNDNWEEGANAALIPSITATLGAQPLSSGSRDAVLLVALPPGIYTPQISGVGSTSGVSLVEFYNVE